MLQPVFPSLLPISGFEVKLRKREVRAFVIRIKPECFLQCLYGLQIVTLAAKQSMQLKVRRPKTGFQANRLPHKRLFLLGRSGSKRQQKGTKRTRGPLLPESTQPLRQLRQSIACIFDQSLNRRMDHLVRGRGIHCGQECVKSFPFPAKSVQSQAAQPQ